MRTFMALFAAAAVVGLAACGEKPQTVHYENGKFRGKPDDRPWESSASAASADGSWVRGDPDSWRGQIRSRNAATQNESYRIRD